MREYAAPPLPGATDHARLTDALVEHADRRPDHPLMAVREGRDWRDVAARELRDQVVATARGLLAAGVEHGDRVALLCRTRPEWTVLDYAAWWVGAITVPVYATSSQEQVGWVLRDSGCRHLVLEGSRHLPVLEALRADLPALDNVWLVDDDASTAYPSLADLRREGEGVTADELEQRRSAVTGSDPATVIYTSGTTGEPKGCVLTHDNFLFEARATAAELPELFDEEGAATLLVLPLAHVFARIVQVGALERGVRLGHSADPRRLLDDVGGFRPTFLLGVPRVFENAVTQLSQTAAAEGRGRAFDRSIDVALAWSRAERPGRVLRARHAVYDRLVYSRVREAFGGRCRFGISGGAPLGERLAHFFRGAGIPVLEGYGMTETTGASTVNTPDNHRVGTVGRPLPGTAVKVEEDGELLLRGPHLMAGYWDGERSAVAAPPGEGDDALLQPDGWLRTGDLAEIDAEGFVRVTGRKKEILVTAGGKNVSPAHLEERVRSHPLVSQCLVVGDGQPFVAALVTLDPDAYAEWAARTGKGTLADHTHDPDLRAEVQKAVDRANATVSQAESVRRFEILPVDWTEESGALTASRKLRRNVVVRQFRHEIHDLFS